MSEMAKRKTGISIIDDPAKREILFLKLDEDTAKRAAPHLDAIDRWLACDGRRLGEFRV
jgi:hypothetical protein